MRVAHALVGTAVAVSVAAGALMTVLAAPAQAHTVGGVQPTNYRSRISGVSPALPGVSVELLDLGRRIRVINRGTTDVIVLGYSGEPYLRLGPRGLFENVHSPAAFLNLPTTGGATTNTTLPPGADASAPPSWRFVSHSQSVTWHDRRTRWEGPAPSSVTRHPHETQVVRSWAIGLTTAGPTSVVTGLITWVPGPNPVPWLLVAAGLAAVTVAAAFTPWWAPLLAAAMALLVANDVVHSFVVADASRDPVGRQLVTVLLVGFYGTIAWVVGIAGAVLVRRRSDTGVVLAVASAFLITLLGGITDAVAFGRSQLPFAWPPGVARAEVALSLGVGVGVVAALGWLYLRTGAFERSETSGASTPAGYK